MGYGILAMGYGLWAIGDGRLAIGDGIWRRGERRMTAFFWEENIENIVDICVCHFFLLPLSPNGDERGS